MAKGRDEVATKSFSPETFLLTPEMSGLKSTYLKRGKEAFPMVPTEQTLVNLKAVIDATRKAIEFNLGTKWEDSVDQRFGKGATDWLMKNLNQFEPNAQLQLYYLLENLPKADLPSLDKNEGAPLIKKSYRQ